MIRISVDALSHALSVLPVAATYPNKEYSFQVKEPFDPEYEGRPDAVRLVTLVFKKNFNGDGWDMTFDELAYRTS